MTVRLGTLTLTLLFLVASIMAQEADTADVDNPPDTVSAAAPDSRDIQQPNTDSLADSTMIDSGLTPSSFDERYAKYRRKFLERKPQFSYFDSLVVYFTSERLNLNTQRDRSWYHDAGDYFRSDPSFLTLDHQESPMRKTVQPFGLSGDRMNLVVNGMSVHPFDHVIEPDGLVDMNDLPTAFDRDIYIMSGPVGRLFGGRQVIASLITLPEKPSGSVPKTAILGDKGNLSYSWVRGRYARRYQTGRQIDASVGYRESEGSFQGREDDGYHYVGDFYFPLGGRHGFRAAGQVYNRDGNQVVRRATSAANISRDRFDRYAELSFDRSDTAGSLRYTLGYRHDRQGSFSDGAYTSRYNRTSHGAFLMREWIMGRTIMRTRVSGDYIEYESYQDLFSRVRSDATFSLAHLADGMRYALEVGGRYDDEFSFLPDAAAVVSKESDRMLLQLSVGYCERAPSLHELFLPYQRAKIYRSDSSTYGNEGNRDLQTEKQLVGSILYEWGDLDNATRLTVTGGRISDGIDWQRRWETDSVSTYLLFSPVNGDIDFANATLIQRLKLADFLRFTGGGAYHYAEYAAFDDKAYSPEYQAFGGLELHYYWKPKLLHLFAYAEAVYVGPYHGLAQGGLGEKVLANGKLTLGLKDFRFHFVFQNLLAQTYQQRDFMTMSGVFFYYGLVWNFDN